MNIIQLLGHVGNNVPKVDAVSSHKLYKAIGDLTDAELVRSIMVPGSGGLAVAFAKMAMGGNLGLDIDISKIPASGELSLNEILFSETSSRFVITVAPDKIKKFEKLLDGFVFAEIGKSYC